MCFSKKKLSILFENCKNWVKKQTNFFLLRLTIGDSLIGVYFGDIGWFIIIHLFHFLKEFHSKACLTSWNFFMMIFFSHRKTQNTILMINNCHFQMEFFQQTQILFKNDPCSHTILILFVWYHFPYHINKKALENKGSIIVFAMHF